MEQGTWQFPWLSILHPLTPRPRVNRTPDENTCTSDQRSSVGVLEFHQGICILKKKNQFYDNNSISGKTNKNLHFEISNNLLLICFSKGAQVLKQSNAVQTFSSFLLLLKICRTAGSNRERREKR